MLVPKWGNAVARLSQRYWIPPAGLAAGSLAHGVSWLLLLVLSLRGSIGIGLPSLAWVHLVALGWLTMTALAVLVHVIPTFTEAPWKGERLARASLAVYAVGLFALVSAFWTGSPASVAFGAALVVIALSIYLTSATRTLATAFAHARVEAAIARALAITLTCLLVAALLGVAMAWALAGWMPARALGSLPPVHAAFGTIGWLTVLVMGVSTRTIRPISGARSRWPRVHIVSGTLEIVGLVAFATGSMFDVPSFRWIGAITIFVGALAYAGDVIDTLSRARVAHRPPQAFVGTAAIWLVVGIVLAIGTLGGAPWAMAATFVLLVGWLGQMVNGHIYHIGIRLIATIARGDDDETSPRELLATPLTWLSFAAFQIAVALGGTSLVLAAPELLAVAALAGLLGWIAMMVNIALAIGRAARAPATQDPLTISLLSGLR